MSRHLTARDIEAILGLIDGWRDRKLQWRPLQNAIEERLGFRPTRQTLSAHDRIRLAYQQRRKGPTQAGPAPTSGEAVLKARLDRLQAECARLRNENRVLMEQLVRWQYNGECHGLGLDTLNRPLPGIDRERTDN